MKKKNHQEFGLNFCVISDFTLILTDFTLFFDQKL